MCKGKDLQLLVKIIDKKENDIEAMVRDHA